MTFRSVTFGIMTLNRMAFIIILRIALSRDTSCRIQPITMLFIKMTLIRMTLSRMTLTSQQGDTWQNSTHQNDI